MDRSHKLTWGMISGATAFCTGPYAFTVIRFLLGLAEAGFYPDPVLREAFRRTIPFEWSELNLEREAETSFLADAVSHGVGPHGFSIPVLSKRGHRGHLGVLIFAV